MESGRRLIRRLMNAESRPNDQDLSQSPVQAEANFAFRNLAIFSSRTECGVGSRPERDQFRHRSAIWKETGISTSSMAIITTASRSCATTAAASGDHRAPRDHLQSLWRGAVVTLESALGVQVRPLTLGAATCRAVNPWCIRPGRGHEHQTSDRRVAQRRGADICRPSR